MATVPNSIIMIRMRLQAFYLLIVFYFQTEDYAKTSQLFSRFENISNQYSDRLISEQKECADQNIDIRQLKAIQKLLQKWDQTIKVEQETPVKNIPKQEIDEEIPNSANEPSQMSQPSLKSKFNDILQLSNDLIYLSELQSIEKMQAFNQYVRNYYESKGNILFFYR